MIWPSKKKVAGPRSTCFDGVLVAAQAKGANEKQIRNDWGDTEFDIEPIFYVSQLCFKTRKFPTVGQFRLSIRVVGFWGKKAHSLLPYIPVEPINLKRDRMTRSIRSTFHFCFALECCFRGERFGTVKTAGVGR